MLTIIRTRCLELRHLFLLHVPLAIMTGALKQKMISEGWEVRKSKVDGGCFEVYGTPPEGDRVEAYFAPVTLEKLFVHQRGIVLFQKTRFRYLAKSVNLALESGHQSALRHSS